MRAMIRRCRALAGRQLALPWLFVLAACGSPGSSSGPAPDAGSPASPMTEEVEDRRPNIIWIVADDLGYADSGFQGSDLIQTPHLDGLAASGVRFLQAYATSSVCSPSRAGLLTGRYQQRFGHEHNIAQDGVGGLRRGEVTIAEHLRGAGYRTHLVGKWHLGVDPESHPRNHGFDHFFGLLGGSRSYFARGANPPHQALQRHGRPVPDPPGAYLTELFGEEAERIVQDAPEPLFLLLSFTAPHTPLEARTADRMRFDAPTEERATLAAMTYSMDEAIGRVLEGLDRRGIRRRTLVAFTSDNGGAAANHSDNAGLRGHKGSLYEGGVRVPMILSWPGVVPQQADVHEAVSTLDWFATSAAAAGALRAGVEGRDLRPLLSGRGGWRERELFWRRGRQAAVRLGDWKLIREAGEFELYDLTGDAGERQDLASARPEVAARLSSLLSDWETELAEPRWEPGGLREEAAGSRGR